MNKKEINKRNFSYKYVCNECIPTIYAYMHIYLL